MKIVLNTSNLYFGGGLQVALSFINELKTLNKKHNYYIFLSQALKKQIDQASFAENFIFYLLETTPAKLQNRKKTVQELDRLENSIEPDIVFSLFGPSYWKPKSKHIMGFANGWVLQKDSIAYGALSFLQRVKMRLWVEYVQYYAKRDATYYILETEDARARLEETFKVSKKNTFVVGNSYSSVFDMKELILEKSAYYIQLPQKEENEFRLLLISHNQPSKNIKIVNKLIPLLKNYNIKFIFTIDEVSFQSLFANKPNEVINVGPIAQKSCPSLYKQCDALFLPTLLEIFTASYPEAMKMQKPILTSNYSFATEVCADAAFFFDPLSPEDMAEKIIELYQNKHLEKELIAKGEKRLLQFETAGTRAKKYIEICEKIVNTTAGEVNV